MKTMILALLITIIGIAFTIGESRAINKDLVLAYDFEKVQGNTVKDVSENGNDGELMGDPQKVEGVMGLALAFDGIDDYIDLGDDKFLSNEMTVMFWANNIGVQPNNWPTYFTIREADGSAAGIYWDKGSSEVRIFALKPGVIGEENLRDNATQVVADDEWHHIAGIFSANSGMEIYIDGKLKASDDLFVGSPADLKETNTYIARGRTHNAGEYVNGNIDEFVIIKKVLTEQAMLSHRDRGVEGALALQPSGKLATTWARIKERP
jgi:hypothetical protein